MKLIDRLTQQSLQAEELLHLDAIVPERYVLLEQDEQIQSVMIPKFSFLFADGGTIRLNSSKTLHTYIPDITLTITESIKYISELVKACCLEASFQSLPNPLVPNSVFNAETKLKPLEKMLQDVIEKGHLHHIAYNPRMDMRYDEELVDVNRAKKISNKAHRYLAGHSETWQQRSLVGIRPKKVLARLSDDELLIYENKVFAQLLDKLRFYVASRLNDLVEQHANLQAALSLGDSSDTYYKLSHELCELWAENLTADETENILSQLEETIFYNQQLLSTIKKLQSSGLYVQIPPPHRKVADQLHKTNILNYDQHYRHLNRLWLTLYEQKNKTPSFKEKISSYWRFQHDYVEAYSLLIILKAFSSLGFQINSMRDQSSTYSFQRGSLDFTLQLDIDLKIWKISSQLDVLNIVPIANDIDEHSLEELGHHPNLVVFSLGTEEASNQSDRLVWVNPFNFEAVEKFIVILLEWIYKPMLQSYSKALQLGRIPQSVRNELSSHSYIVNKDEQIKLVNVLNPQQLSTLETVCISSNTENIYRAIKKKHDDYLHLTHCPICLSKADFEPRPSNQTFIAECSNPECGINYKLVSNANQDKNFYLQAAGDWMNGGRWQLNFKV
ncbi:hypothetical protein [Acinetobacter sp. TR3]|uniref:hypothetical protein n=1 Tax=Acinetobacter sp. TR3 TaxID=3003392 RepID=UPI0022AC787F|nr:hypothetical protein [Acinetobacter sp. TR3]WAU77577.1 hypothetical protein O1449_05185 [Acinetobacter sp. TR3]